MWSGIINAREKDYRTAYSYLYEALEQFNVANDPKAFDSLKSAPQTRQTDPYVNILID